MAGLLCQIVMKDWGSHGCRENPDQEPCRKTLGVLDTDLKASGLSMLFEAAHAGRTDICSVMISAGGDPNAANSAGWTPVMIAAAENKPDTVKLLARERREPECEELARPNAGHVRGELRLYRHCRDVGASRRRPEHQADGQGRKDSAHRGRFQRTRRHRGRSPPPGRPRGKLWTPTRFTALMHAALGGNVEVMRALLDGGADINAGVLVGTPSPWHPPGVISMP